MRQRVNTGMDSDALQADVMRFMAIIAFCLIAVLALVQQIEPVEEAAEVRAIAGPPAEADEPVVHPLEPLPQRVTELKPKPQVKARPVVEAAAAPVVAQEQQERPPAPAPREQARQPALAEPLWCSTRYR